MYMTCAGACGRHDKAAESACQHVANHQDLKVLYTCMQASPVAAATTQGTISVPLPKSKAVDNRTWAQRVSADGRKYFVDPVTRQTTWHDPVSQDL